MSATVERKLYAQRGREGVHGMFHRSGLTIYLVGRLTRITENVYMISNPDGSVGISFGIEQVEDAYETEDGFTVRVR